MHSNSRLPTPTTPLLFETGRIFPVQLSVPSGQSSPVQVPQVQDTAITSSVASSVPAVQRSPFADMLNIPIMEKPKKHTTTGKACVLTSAECLKMLKDKENEKHQKAEEKEKRNTFPFQLSCEFFLLVFVSIPFLFSSLFLISPV